MSTRTSQACLDVVALSRLAANELAGATLDAARRHVDGCERCTAALAALRIDEGEAAPRLVAARYRLVARLGRGGMGEVHRAHDTHLGRDVALKIMRAHVLVPSIVMHEARAIAAVRHPHIVTVYDAFVDDGISHVTMELVDGGTLRERRARLGRDTLTHTFFGLAEGLATLHEAGVVHGDVKPENVLWDARAGVAKLADFGLARLREGLDVVAAPTRRYAAPELVTGPARLPDARTDQYALARTWLEAYAGEAALSDDPHDDIAPALRAAPPPLRRVLARALAPAPEARHPSMRSLIAAARTAFIGRRAALGTIAALVVAAAIAVPFIAHAETTRACSSRAIAELPALVLPPELDVEATTRLLLAHRRWVAGVASVEAQRCARSEDPHAALRARCLEVERHRVATLLGLIAVGAADDLYHRSDLINELEDVRPTTCRDDTVLHLYAAGRSGASIPTELIARAYGRVPPGERGIAETRELIARLTPHGPSRALYQALFALRMRLEAEGQDDESVELAQRAVLVALALADPFVLRRAFLSEGEAYLFRRDDTTNARLSLARARALETTDNHQDFERAGRLESEIHFIEGDLVAMAASAQASLTRHHDGETLLGAAYLSMFDLMLARFELGDYAAAHALAHEALAVRLMRSPRENARVAGLLRYAGWSALRMGRLDEARDPILEARSIRHRLLGADHVETQLVELAYLELLVAEGEPEQAAARARETLAILDRLLRPRTVMRVRAALVLGRIGLAIGDLDLARRALALVDDQYSDPQVGAQREAEARHPPRRATEPYPRYGAGSPTPVVAMQRRVADHQVAGSCTQSMRSTQSTLCGVWRERFDRLAREVAAAPYS